MSDHTATFLGYGENEYGTCVSRFRCDTCGEEFTCCPTYASLGKSEETPGCQSKKCDSYDVRGDVSLMMDDPELWEKLSGEKTKQIHKRPCGLGPTNN